MEVSKQEAKKLAAVVVMAIALLYLEAALFLKFSLPVNVVMVPEMVVGSARAMGDVGILIALGVILYVWLAIVPKTIKSMSQAMKFVLGATGIIGLASGVGILVATQMFSLGWFLGAVFGILGLNMALRLINKKLF